VDRATTDPLVGTTVAQYEIVARLGGGGMGVVYAARDTKLGRRVALKFLPPQWSHDESAKLRFIREAQAASATDHPNICTIHDIATAGDGQLFIVMAHYEGETLKQRLERGPIGVEEVVEIGAQVAEGLAKAHGQGVVHRDIKPGNLMLTEDGVKILDFGLAKFADARLKLTLEGSTLGTVAYMSPEQARGEEADARSDVWATGVVLYEMLAGHPPFRGGYPEAISHAIKHDSPAPLRTARSDVSEPLEHIVFRALHKDPGVRYQTARDLARALRQLQGRTLPIDLRTEVLPVASLTTPRPPAGRRTRRAVLASAAGVLVLTSAVLWVLSPVERIPIAVAPVVNQTGYAELDTYRLALVQALTSSLSHSRTVKVLPYDRVLQIVRPFRQEGRDPSSSEALQALTMRSDARALVIPILVYENGAWKARIELRNAQTATNEARYESAPVVSSLAKDAVYTLLASLTDEIDAHFTTNGPIRAYLADRLRRVTGFGDRVPQPSLKTLDAAAAFETGIDAYEQQEYSAALRSFAAAAKLEPRNALLHAWQSRSAWLMRRDKEALDAAEEAVRLLGPEVLQEDTLFVQAVAAEARRDAATAEANYRDLERREPDEPIWLMERAGFEDRRLKTSEAVATYHRALALDGRIVRAHLELCRLYGPNRLNDPPNAKEQGQRALDGFRALGSRAGEGQALWCLTDVLRVGSQTDRLEARRHADEALAIFQQLQLPYNLSRAEYYVALAALYQGKPDEAAAVWEQSLAGARKVGNAVLEPLLLMNLGVVYEALGDRARAAANYAQSRARYEALGDEARAAQQQANEAALLIEWGPRPADGLRNIQNALAVVRKLGDKNFEAFCLQVIAAFYRYAGRHAEAVAELNRAFAILKERNLEDDVAYVTIDLARSSFDAGDYAQARGLLVRALGDGSGPRAPEARLRLGRTNVYLGDLATAASELSEGAAAVKGTGQSGLIPLVHTALGELAYESGDVVKARKEFEQASALWTSDLPDAMSVEGRAYAGLIDALGGAADRGRATLLACLEQARAMGRFALEARIRVFLARIDVNQRRFDRALMTLDEIPPDSADRTIGKELRAQAHYWRGEALAGRGDANAASMEHSQAGKILEDLRSSLPDPDRTRFAARPDIRAILTVRTRQ
jgi:serine/threonine protein kinase/tetratricopeptide (TPR) repeat protein